MPIQTSGGPVGAPTQKYFLGELLWKKIETVSGVTTTTYYLPR